MVKLSDYNTSHMQELRRRIEAYEQGSQNYEFSSGYLVLKNDLAAVETYLLREWNLRYAAQTAKLCRSVIQGL